MAPAGELRVSLSGLMMIEHKVSVSDDTDFDRLLAHLADSDVRIADLLSVMVEGHEWPIHVGGGGRSATYLWAPPAIADELKALGLDLVLTASAHATDFGESGLVTTLKHLDRVGIQHSGTGSSLTAATAPTYLDTKHARIAVICASDWGPRGLADLPAAPAQGAIAADGSAFFPARPGINIVRFSAVQHVDSDTIAALRRASEALGWEAAKRLRRSGGGRNMPMSERIFDEETDTDTEFYFMGSKFVRSQHFGFSTVPYREDLDRNYMWIREARRQADFVIVVLHQHGAERAIDDPADHFRTFARGAIDNGADLVARSSTLPAAGIELYKNAPIIYGLTSLVLQPGQMEAVPPEAMLRWGLSPQTNTPTDWLDARDEAEATAVGHLRERWLGNHAVTHTLVFGSSGSLAKIELRPLYFSDGSRARLGAPRLASPDSAVAAETLAVFTDRCGRFGTRMQVDHGVGTVEIPAA